MGFDREWSLAAAFTVLTVFLGGLHFTERSFESDPVVLYRLFGTLLAIVIAIIAVLRSSSFAAKTGPVYLPAEGKTPLTDAQVRIIEWWITAGLPHQTTMVPPGVEVERQIREELELK